MLRKLLDVDDATLERGALEIECDSDGCRKYVLEGTSPGGAAEKRWIVSRLMEYTALLEKAAEHAALFVIVEVNKLTLVVSAEYLSLVFLWSGADGKTLQVMVDVFKARKVGKKLRPLLLLMPPSRAKAFRAVYEDTSLDSALRLFKRFVRKFVLPGRREKQKTVLV